MAAASPWQPNTGHAPGADRVFVRLRNGMEPASAWPVQPDRGPATRWTLTNHPFDITHWRPA